MANQHSLEMNSEHAQALCSKLAKIPSFRPAKRDYATFCYEGDGVNVAYYPKKGRLLVQGKEADDFVKTILDLALPPGAATVVKTAKTDKKPVSAGSAGLDTRPHFGIDESGKGDYFGPLVIAGVYSCPETAALLREAGCKDSKQVGDDRHIHAIAERIKKLPGVAWEIVCIGPKRYNELYAEFTNLNRLLAWGHARVIASLHEKVPACPRALSDQFANARVLQQAMRQRNIPVELEQRTKGESDIAVAAASILARDRFVQWMNDASSAAQFKFPLGCAPHVVKAARDFVARYGQERLQDVAKLHFKVTARVTK